MSHEDKKNFLLNNDKEVAKQVAGVFEDANKVTKTTAPATVEDVPVPNQNFDDNKKDLAVGADGKPVVVPKPQNPQNRFSN